MRVHDDLSDMSDIPWDAVEFMAMIEELRHSLSLAEINLESQYQAQVRKIGRMIETQDFEHGDEDQLKETATRRFTVTLPLLARYGALVSLITSVEWAVELLVSLLGETLNAKPPNSNKTVHRLSQLVALTGVHQADAVREFEALVHVRNCIAHNAGIVKGYKARRV